MPGKDRKKELARQHYERQIERREAREKRARLRALVGGAVVVALVAAGGAALAVGINSGDDGNAAADPTPTPTTPEAPTDGKPKKQIAFENVAVKGSGKGSGTCKYMTSKDQGAPKGIGKPPTTPAYKGDVKATIKTNLGTIGMTLDGSAAPCTTNSIAYLADKKFYEKTSCHRLTTSELKVLQCGDPTGQGAGGPGYRFANENTKGAQYKRGVVAMAHSQQPDSNGSQFFILFGDSQLPADYTIFGKITSGMDIVDQVAKAGVAAQ